MNAKLHTPNKPKYVSKADRAKLDEEESAQDDNTQNQE